MATGKGAALPPLVRASAGAFGAVVSNAIVFPLDLTTTRMQTQPLPKRSSKRRRPPSPYSTLPLAFRTILRTEGFLAFYRGLAPDTLSTFLSNLLFYYFYSALSGAALRRKKLKLEASGGGGKGKGKAPIHLGAVQELLIGCGSGMLSKAVTMPLSNVTVRQQTAANEKADKPSQKAQENGNADAEGRSRRDSTSSDSSDDSDVDYSSSPSLLSTIRLLIKERGFFGLWAGFPSTCLLTLSPSITLYLFEFLKRLTLPKQSRLNPSAFATFLTSATASAIANAMLYPLILSKVLAQYRGSGGATAAVTPGVSRKSGRNPRYHGTFGPLRMAWDRQGVRGVTVGLEAQLMKNFIGQGTTMMVKGQLESMIIEAWKRSKGIA